MMKINTQSRREPNLIAFGFHTKYRLQVFVYSFIVSPFCCMLSQNILFVICHSCKVLKKLEMNTLEKVQKP